MPQTNLDLAWNETARDFCQPRSSRKSVRAQDMAFPSGSDEFSRLGSARGDLTCAHGPPGSVLNLRRFRHPAAAEGFPSFRDPRSNAMDSTVFSRILRIGAAATRKACSGQSDARFRFDCHSLNFTSFVSSR